MAMRGPWCTPRPLPSAADRHGALCALGQRDQVRARARVAVRELVRLGACASFLFDFRCAGRALVASMAVSRGCKCCPLTSALRPVHQCCIMVLHSTGAHGAGQRRWRDAFSGLPRGCCDLARSACAACPHGSQRACCPPPMAQAF